MIDMIFNYIHLFIVLTVTAYAFYKYIIPEAKKNIIKRNNYLSKLKNDKKIAISTQNTIDFQISQEELKYIDIKSKISYWIKLNKQKVEQEILEDKNIYTQLEQKIKLQSKIYKNNMIDKQIASPLIDNLEKKFYKYFENNDNSYISKILNNIEQK